MANKIPFGVPRTRSVPSPTGRPSRVRPEILEMTGVGGERPIVDVPVNGRGDTRMNVIERTEQRMRQFREEAADFQRKRIDRIIE